MSVKKTSGYWLSQQEPLDAKFWLTSSEMQMLPLSDRYKWMIIINKTDGKLYQLQPLQGMIDISNDLVTQWVFKILQFGNSTSEGGGITEWKSGKEYKTNDVIFYINKILIAQTDNINKTPIINGIVDLVNWKEIDISINSHERNKDIRLGYYPNRMEVETYKLIENLNNSLIVRQLDIYNTTILVLSVDPILIGSLIHKVNDTSLSTYIPTDDIFITFVFPDNVSCPGITFLDYTNESIDTENTFRLGVSSINFAQNDGVVGQFIHFKKDDTNRFYIYNSSKKASITINNNIINSDLEPVLDILPDSSYFPTDNFGDRYIVGTNIYQKTSSISYSKVLDSSTITIGKGIVVTKDPASWYIWDGIAWVKDAAYDPSAIDNVINHLKGDDSIYKRFTTAYEQDVTNPTYTKINTSKRITDSIKNHIRDIGTYYSTAYIDSPNTSSIETKVTIYDVKSHNNASQSDKRSWIEAYVPVDNKKFIAVVNAETNAFDLQWTQIYPVDINSIGQFNLGDLSTQEDFVLSIDSNGKVTPKDLRYTDLVPASDNFRGISVGETFNKVPITTMINKFIHMYNAPVISTFVTNIPINSELGGNITNPVTFTWNIANPQNVLIDTVLNKHITIADMSNGNTILHTTDLTNGTVSITLSPVAIGVTRQFNMTLFDIKGNMIIKSIILNGLKPIYFGCSVNPTIDNAGVYALQKYLNPTWKTNYSFVASGYKYIAIPTSTGTPSMFVDLDTGFQVAMNAPTIITLAQGTYNLYRSANILNSAIIITVK